MRVALAALVIVMTACRGGDTGEAVETGGRPEVAAMPGAAQRVETGTVHDVQMLGTPDGRFMYQPASLTIRRGDRVRWINVSGGPHNVAFHANQVPEGAAAFLRAAMTRRIDDLAGELLFQANAVYEIGFAGAPAGIYNYFCTPHEMLGMTGQLTILQ